MSLMTHFTPGVFSQNVESRPRKSGGMLVAEWFASGGVLWPLVAATPCKPRGIIDVQNEIRTAINQTSNLWDSRRSDSAGCLFCTEKRNG